MSLDPSGCKKLKGGQQEWRIRVGPITGLRVYTIDDAKLRVSVKTRIRHRSEVYEGSPGGGSGSRVARNTPLPPQRSK